MKKIVSTIMIFFMFAIFSTSIMAYETINVNIKDVQTTEIDIVFNKKDLHKNTQFDLPNNIEYLEMDNQIAIRMTISNVNFENSFTKIYQSLIDALRKNNPKIAEELESKEITVQSNFYGYPFGGRTTIAIDGKNIEKDINVKINGTYSLNYGDYVESGVITPDDFPAYIEFGITTIDSMNILVEPQTNYKTVNVTYTINSNTGVLDDMSKDKLAQMGYNVVNQGPNNLQVTYTYNDMYGFNNLFDMELLEIFNVVGKIDIEGSKSLINNMSISGAFYYSESIDDIKLTIKMPENAKDKISKHEGETFTYDLTQPTEFDISFTSINIGTIIILLLVSLCSVFVIAALMKLNKRGSHIRFK